MNTRIMDTLTGLFRPRGDAKTDPKGTVEVTINKPPFTKEQLRYIYSALDAQSGSSRNADMRVKLLAKIDGMLG